MNMLPTRLLFCAMELIQHNSQKTVKLFYVATHKRSFDHEINILQSNHQKDFL